MARDDPLSVQPSALTKDQKEEVKSRGFVKYNTISGQCATKSK